MTLVATRRTTTMSTSSRSFKLTVIPDRGDAYGIRIVEADEITAEPTMVLSANSAQTHRVIDAVIAAVKASGYAPGRLARNRGSVLKIDESAGVRLSLILFATQPLTRHDRIREIVAGVNVMSVEETYYWYAKCVGAESSRARRALRTLLSDDKTEI